MRLTPRRTVALIALGIPALAPIGLIATNVSGSPIVGAFLGAVVVGAALIGLNHAANAVATTTGSETLPWKTFTFTVIGAWLFVAALAFNGLPFQATDAGGTG
jgi:hypothetical protein